MNVHDEAHNLAKALKESSEYLNFKAAQLKIQADPGNYEIVKDYIQKQMAVQTKQMLGQELTDEEISAYNSLTQSVLGIPVIAEYFQAQMKFGTVFQDIMDILNNAIDFDLGFLNEESHA